MVGREFSNIRQLLVVFGKKKNQPSRRDGDLLKKIKKWFSSVSCSNLALRILKLRRENFKQTGSSIFKIGWELRSPQSIECTALQQRPGVKEPSVPTTPPRVSHTNGAAQAATALVVKELGPSVPHDTTAATNQRVVIEREMIVWNLSNKLKVMITLLNTK